MNVHVKVIPHKQQRYDTVGDWWYDGNGDLQIRVSKMKDGRYEQIIEIHERIEAFLCEEANVDVTDIDNFDKEYEQKRPAGDKSEPGNSIKAPYYRQHQMASGIERILIAEVDLDYNDYEKEVNGLKY